MFTIPGRSSTSRMEKQKKAPLAKRCLDNCQAEYGDTVCRVGEVLLAFSSGILTVVTFGTGYWLQSRTVSDSGPLYHYGLWQNCSSLKVESCTTIPLNGPSKKCYRVWVFLLACTHTVIESKNRTLCSCSNGHENMCSLFTTFISHMFLQVF